MRKVFLIWKPFCTRSHNQATHFGAKEIYIFPFPNLKKNVLVILLRYACSFVLTFSHLIKERPEVIFTLNQPPFLILAIFIYSRISGAKYILDSHSAPFNDAKWAWFRPIYALIAKNAMLNINTSSHHKAIVEKWGGRSEIMSDIPIDHGRSYPKRDVAEKSVMVVASFMFDEPMEEIWEAARSRPDIIFYVTGNPDKATSALHKNKPENITFTGFIPVEEYFSLMVSVDAVMVLTTRDFTMQRGAYEALSLKKPIITSDWLILRESFGKSATYVNNSAEDIARGVRDTFVNLKAIEKAAAKQKITRREYYDKTRDKILDMISQT